MKPTCPNCGGPMVDLLFSTMCEADCGKPKPVQNVEDIRFSLPPGANPVLVPDEDTIRAMAKKHGLFFQGIQHSQEYLTVFLGKQKGLAGQRVVSGYVAVDLVVPDVTKALDREMAALSRVIDHQNP